MNTFLEGSFFEEMFYLEGNLVGTTTMKDVLETIEKYCGRFEIRSFECGVKKEDTSKAEIYVASCRPEDMGSIKSELKKYGATTRAFTDANFTSVTQNRIAPDNFYHTTNLETEIRINDEWHSVLNQKMDALIVWDGKNARCVKLGSLEKGMLVVTGGEGVRTKDIACKKDKNTFSFMSGDVSPETNNDSKVGYIARLLHNTRSQGKKIAYVLGPAVVHSGADRHVSNLIKEGFVDVLLAGNALAVHDMEKSLYGTSLGICKRIGKSVENGYKNHLKTINEVNKKGSIKKAVDSGIVKEGIMYECIRNNIPYVLAGSIRDDGPLFDVISDTKEAQNAYLEALECVGMVIIGATMLHGIAVGNLLHAGVLTVCVDMETAVVNKLKDRGTWQAIGIVDNVSHFFEKLYLELASCNNLISNQCQH